MRVVGNFIAGGLLVITVGLLSNAQAIVLGDIQVKSLLVQPLKATISISELDNLVVKNLEVGLAGVTDYEKLGLQYLLKNTQIPSDEAMSILINKVKLKFE